MEFEYFKHLWTHVQKPNTDTTMSERVLNQMIELKECSDLNRSTIEVAVVFMRRFLEEQHVSRDNYYLLSTACILVASKVLENRKKLEVLKVCMMCMCFCLYYGIDIQCFCFVVYLCTYIVDTAGSRCV